MSEQINLNMSGLTLPKELIFPAGDLVHACNALSSVADGNKDSGDKLIYFNVISERSIAIVSSKDPYRECSITIPVTSFFSTKFAVKSTAITASLVSEGAATLTVDDFNVVLTQSPDASKPLLVDKTMLTKYEHDYDFKNSSIVEDDVDTGKFVSLVKTFESYLSSKELKYGLLCFTDNLMYVKNQLFYLVSRFPMNKEYIFDKTTCKLIARLFSARADSSLKLCTIEGGTHINIRSGNISLWCKDISHEKMDVQRFLRIKPISTYLVDSNVFVQKVKRLTDLGESVDLDVKIIDNVLSVKPAKEGSLTEYRIPIRSVELEGVENRKKFSMTVNGDTLRAVLSHVNTDSVMISNSDDNVMLIQNLNESLRLMYFINIF